MQADALTSVNAYLIIVVLLTVLNFFAYLAMGMFVWIAKAAIKDLRDLEKSHNNLSQELPMQYVTKNDYRQDVRELKDMLREIFNKLDGKADKP